MFWTEIENCHYTVNVLTICESADKCHTNKMRNESGGVCVCVCASEKKQSFPCLRLIVYSGVLCYASFFYHYTITSFFHCKMRLFYFSLVSSSLSLSPSHSPMCFFFVFNLQSRTNKRTLALIFACQLLFLRLFFFRRVYVCIFFSYFFHFLTYLSCEFFYIILFIFFSLRVYNGISMCIYFFHLCSSFVCTMNSFVLLFVSSRMNGKM